MTNKYKQIRKIFAKLCINLNYNAEWEEYSVKVMNDREATRSFHGNDLQDAIDTGLYLAQTLQING